MLSGTGGVGKTQLAARHAQSQWDARSLDLLIWVTASRTEVLDAYVQAAEAIGIAWDGSPDKVADRFRTWLANTSRRWLIVLDDLADPADLQNLWPPDRPSGQAIVTTRRRDATLTGPGRQLDDVGLFTPAEAAAYLTANLFAHGKTDDPAQIAALAHDLGYLPLALSQAAAFLVDSTLDGRAYRRRLADCMRTLTEIMPIGGGLPDGQRTTLAVTWRISIKHADKLRPPSVARPLLELASMLDPNGIPEAVLTSDPALAYLTARTRTRRKSGTQPAAATGDRPVSSDDAKDAISCLRLLSLAEVTETDAGILVRVHELIQRSVRESVREYRVGALAQAAADALMACWPPVERDPVIGQALRANAAVLATNTRGKLWTDRAHPVLYRAGRSIGQAGQADAAVAYWRGMVDRASTLLGEDHPDTLTARHDAAYWRGEAGDPGGAAVATQEVMLDHIRVLGPDHPDTIETRAHVAQWVGRSGDPERAARITEDVLEDCLRLYEPDHPDILAARNNLALWMSLSDDLAGALKVAEELLPGVERVQGLEDESTLIVRCNIAVWRGQLGDPVGARDALGQLAAECEEYLGSAHETTLMMRGQFARWTGIAGDPNAARRLFEALLADRRRLSGDAHPSVLGTRGNIARFQGESGDTPGALRSFERLLADCLLYLGPDHPVTKSTSGHLHHWRDQSIF